MFLFVVFGLVFGGILRQSARLSTLRATSSSFEGIATASPFGQRIDARSLTKETFQKYFDGKYPVILTNIFDVENEEWTKELLGALGDKEIEYDVRCSSDGSIESYEATLNDFVSSLSDNSDHDENMYLMNEDLLRNETRLLDFLKGSIPLFGEDLFDHFPKKIRPYQALIIGGVGARSFLHCDPYEWMGINYLFEGRKLCECQMILHLIFPYAHYANCCSNPVIFLFLHNCNLQGLFYLLMCLLPYSRRDEMHRMHGVRTIFLLDGLAM